MPAWISTPWRRRPGPLKEQFQQLWNYESPTWAGKFLDQLCTQTLRSKIEPMKKFARTVRAHRELVLNYFRARKQFYSGVIEGLNNKAKVSMRKAYGFRTFHATELALYRVLGMPRSDLMDSPATTASEDAAVAATLAEPAGAPAARRRGPG